MKSLFSFVFLFHFISSFSQIDSVQARAESVVFWEEQQAHFKNKEESPLGKKGAKKFPGHQVYAFDFTYVITAYFEKSNREDTIIMSTSAGTEKQYVKYAQLHFEINGQHCHLYAYQSLTLREKEEYKNHLFVPFRDATSGKETYGGGRYLDLTIPEGDQIILNFNHAYNPYCAYTTGYFCPIPPAENTLKVAVKAGAKAPTFFWERK